MVPSTRITTPVILRESLLTQSSTVVALRPSILRGPGNMGKIRLSLHDDDTGILLDSAVLDPDNGRIIECERVDYVTVHLASGTLEVW